MELSRSDKESLSRDLKNYLDAELGLEIGLFDAEFLLDFLVEKLGPVIHNKALDDAAQIANEQVQELIYKLAELQQ